MSSSARPAAPAGALLALDVGAKRIGVAVARTDVRIAQPLATLDAADTPQVLRQIADLAAEHGARVLIVGWPRGLSGQATGQTRAVEAFVAELRGVVGIDVELQDEALTSQKAEAELAARRKPFEKADIDALAATYILEDYLRSREDSYGYASEVSHV